MRNLVLTVSLCLLGSADALQAQTAEGRWSLRVGVAREVFSGASSDTTTLPGQEVEVFPAPHMALEAGASRRLGAWELRLTGGYSAGALRAKAPAVLVDDRSGNLKRYRAALLVGRRIASPGPTELSLLAGPAVDHWVVTSIGDRTTVSGRVGLTLSVPLGGIRFANTLLFGFGASPFQRSALPPEALVKTLHSWSFGADLMLPL